MATFSKKDLQDWYIGKAYTAAGYRRKLMSNPARAREGIQIGKLYCYWYDPKHKDTLPIYDRFPMVFPIDRYNDGFLGLNLHYLNGAERKALLTRLMKFSNDHKQNARVRLKLSYDLLNSTKRISTAMRPCIKRYLFGHVQSPFVELHQDEWGKAIALPTEVWVKK